MRNPPGIHGNPAVYAKRLEQGFRMITVSNDTAALVSGAKGMLDAARSGEGGASSLY